MQKTREIISPSVNPSEIAGCSALCSCTERFGAIARGLAEWLPVVLGAQGGHHSSPNHGRPMAWAEVPRSPVTTSPSCVKDGLRILVQAFNSRLYSKNWLLSECPRREFCIALLFPKFSSSIDLGQGTGHLTLWPGQSMSWLTRYWLHVVTLERRQPCVQQICIYTYEDGINLFINEWAEALVLFQSPLARFRLRSVLCIVQHLQGAILINTVFK